MAQIYADVVTTLSLGHYKWAGFIAATLTGGGTQDELYLENQLYDKRGDLDYVRCFVPIYYDGEQFGAIIATVSCAAVYDSSGGAGTEVWFQPGDATSGANSVVIAVVDSAAGPTQHIFFIEYGVEHSVDK